MNWADIAWGTVGEWVGGLATAGGLLFAGHEISASRRDRAEEDRRRREQEGERREAMARAVGVTGIPRRVDRSVYDGPDVPPGEERWEVDYAVHNSGEYPIDRVVVKVLDPGAPKSGQPRPRDAIQVVVGTVLAKQTYANRAEFTLSREPAFAELTHMVSVDFTDTWNQSWHRAPGVLERRDHPARTC